MKKIEIEIDDREDTLGLFYSIGEVKDSRLKNNIDELDYSVVISRRRFDLQDGMMALLAKWISTQGEGQPDIIKILASIIFIIAINPIKIYLFRDKKSENLLKYFEREHGDYYFNFIKFKEENPDVDNIDSLLAHFERIQFIRKENDGRYFLMDGGFSSVKIFESRE